MNNLLNLNNFFSSAKCIGYEKGLYTFLNPYSYIVARKNVKLFSLFHVVFFDGIVITKLVSIFNIVKTRRISFDMTSLAKDVFEFAEQHRKSIYLIGTEQSYISAAVDHIIQCYPRLTIVGFRNGFFENQSERSEVIENIVLMAPDIVVVGMGTPLQEQFLVDLWHQGWRGVGFTCGGFFHQTAHGIEYYPRIMDKYHLRWLYRMYDEPKLIKRYLLDYPKFVVFFGTDYLRYLMDRVCGVSVSNND